MADKTNSFRQDARLISNAWVRIAITVFTCATVTDAALAKRPNYVLLIADDLGYGETGMMGNLEIPTPGIDQLAKDGVRCTSAYVTSSYCSPSRAGIFTGRYQSRFGYDQNPTGKRNLDPDEGLPLSETTFVQRLHDAGYATSLIGKWHLGTAPERQPTARGFDEFFGFLHEGHYYVPGPPYKNVLTMLRDRTLAEGEVVRRDDVIRKNYAPISEPAYDADNPLLKSNADGGLEPVEVDAYLTDVLTQQAVDFIERQTDQPFCLVVAYNAVHSPMQASHRDLANLTRIKDIQRRIFAGMLVAMDRSVQRIRDELARQSYDQNTMVVFLSDNGGPTRELTSSNGPLREGKGSVYEGGLRVPMIWSFPNQFPAGWVEDRVVTSLDVAATMLDFAELPLAEDLDGKSLKGFFTSPKARTIHDRVYWRMQRGKSAYRSGNWKIVRPAKQKPFELYHLAGDLGESNDRSDAYPNKLRELVQQWSAMEAEMQPAK